MQQPEHNPSSGTTPGASEKRVEVDSGRQTTKPAVDRVGLSDLLEARRVGAARRHPLLCEVAAGEPELQELNNALMDCYREHRDGESFALLYRLNVRPFTMVAARVMRMSGCRGDISDVMQESFVAIFRYPTRFRPEKKNAFRNWSYSIIRNTVYRHAQSAVRDGTPVESLAEVLADESAPSPPRVSMDAESDITCKRSYALLLCLYQQIYETELKPRDREALMLVEVQGMGYRDAAEVLGVRLENFKMIVCRARKKIVQALVRILGTQS